MDETYAAYLAGKAPRAQPCGIDPYPMREALFDFQAKATEFCLKRGRAALFLDTGLGKTICELTFAEQAAEATNGCSLILTPLAVARQIEREAERFGFGAHVVRDDSEVRNGINICNYDRLDKLDPSRFGCVVLDESSILKNFTGKTTRSLIEAFSQTPFRLAATATPAPNDHMELGQHCEFLGIMTQGEMLSRWFVNDSADTGTWRLKGHAVRSFWDWIASWAVMAESPADLGFDGSNFVLPPMKIIRHRAEASAVPMDGLFGFNVSATAVHDLKRQTAGARAEAVAMLIAQSPAESWLIWCDTDYEADALVKAGLPDAREVRGSMLIDLKEKNLNDFVTGEYGQLVTKPRIAGFGMNFQHCANQIFVGRSFSYEAWYQCIRRSWRFGQKRTVNVHIIVAEGEDQIGRVIDRKAEDHAYMKSEMRAAMQRNLGTQSERMVPYAPKFMLEMPQWIMQ